MGANQQSDGPLRLAVSLLGLFILFPLLVLLAVGYSESQKQVVQTQQAKTVVALQSCPLPCWEGIIPGQTMHSQLLDLLRTKPKVDTSTGRREIAGMIHSEITWKDSTGITIGHANVWDDRVQALQVNWDRQPPLTVGDLINQYGEPEQVQTKDGLYGQEQAGYRMSLYYPSIGAVFQSVTEPMPRSGRAVMKPELLVPYLSLFAPSSIKTMIATAKDSGFVFLVSDVGLQDWRGFGEYEFLRRIY